MELLRFIWQFFSISVSAVRPLEMSLKSIRVPPKGTWSQYGLKILSI